MSLSAARSKTATATAARIEATASFAATRHPAHDSAGPLALPHYQAYYPPLHGHTFYETPQYKAV